MTSIAHDDPVVDPSGSATAARWRRALPAAVAVLTVITACVVFTWDYHPVSDNALTELFIRQIPHRLPLVGPYSLGRAFSHPSPLFTYLAAIPYTLSGERASAVLVAAVLVNGLALAACVWIACNRRAPGLAAVVILCIVAISDAVHPGLVLLPWNPYFATVPFVLAVFATWAIWTGGSRWSIPVVVGLGSWCAGVHLGFGTAVLGVWVAAAVGVVVATRRGRLTVRALRAPLLVAVAVAAVMWAPTVVDLIRGGTDSNTWAIARFVVDPPVGRVPFRDAVNVLSSELSLRPYWAGGVRPQTTLGSPGHASWPLLGVLTVVALLLARRRRAGQEISGMLVSLSALGAAFAGAALTHSPELLSWYVLPADAAGIAVASFTVWSLARSVTALVPDRHRQLTSTATAVVAVVAFALLGARMLSVRVPGLERTMGDATAAMAPAIVDAVPRDRPIVVGSSLDAREAQPQLVLALAHAGYTVTVPPGDAERFGPWWTRTPAPGATHLYLTAKNRRPEGLRGRPLATTPRLPVILGGNGRIEVWRTDP